MFILIRNWLMHLNYWQHLGSTRAQQGQTSCNYWAVADKEYFLPSKKTQTNTLKSFWALMWPCWGWKKDWEILLCVVQQVICKGSFGKEEFLSFKKWVLPKGTDQEKAPRLFPKKLYTQTAEIILPPWVFEVNTWNKPKPLSPPECFKHLSLCHVKHIFIFPYHINEQELLPPRGAETTSDKPHCALWFVMARQLIFVVKSSSCQRGKVKPAL